MKNNVETWIAWIASTLVAGIVATVFIFNTFQTKAEARDMKQDLQSLISDLKNEIEKRLDRIEKKQDLILEK
jgi:hypothetical protein